MPPSQAGRGGGSQVRQLRGPRHLVWSLECLTNKLPRQFPGRRGAAGLLLLLMCICDARTAIGSVPCASPPSNATMIGLGNACEWVCDGGFTEEGGSCVPCPHCPDGEYAVCGYDRRWISISGDVCDYSACQAACHNGGFGLVYSGRCVQEEVTEGAVSCMCTNSSRPLQGSCVSTPSYNDRPCQTDAFFPVIGFLAIEGHSLSSLTGALPAGRKVDIADCESICRADDGCRCFGLYGGECIVGRSDQCSLQIASTSRVSPEQLHTDRFAFFKLRECMTCTEISCSCLRGKATLPRLGCYEEDWSMAELGFGTDPFSIASSRMNCFAHALSLGHTFFCQSRWNCFTSPGAFPRGRLRALELPGCAPSDTEGFGSAEFSDSVMQCSEIRSSCQCPAGTFLNDGKPFPGGCQSSNLLWIMSVVVPALTLFWVLWCAVGLHMYFKTDSRAEIHCCLCGVRLIAPCRLEEIPVRIQLLGNGRVQCDIVTRTYFPDTMFPQETRCEESACFQYSDGRLRCARHERDLISLHHGERMESLHRACRKPYSMGFPRSRLLGMFCCLFGPVLLCQSCVLIMSVWAVSIEGTGFDSSRGEGPVYDLVTGAGIAGWPIFFVSIWVMICTGFACRESGLLPFLKQRDITPSRKFFEDMDKSPLSFFRFVGYLALGAMVVGRTRKAANSKRRACCWCAERSEVEMSDVQDSSQPSEDLRRGAPPGICRGCASRSSALRMLWARDEDGRACVSRRVFKPSTSPAGLVYPARYTAYVGVEVSDELTPTLAFHGQPLEQFDIVDGELPAGLSIDNKTGCIFGSPTGVENGACLEATYSDDIPLLSVQQQSFNFVSEHTLSIAAFNCAGDCQATFTIEIHRTPFPPCVLPINTNEEENSEACGSQAFEAPELFEYVPDATSTASRWKMPTYRLELGKRCKDIEAVCISANSLTFTVYPQLPIGLQLDEKSGRISGVPLIQTTADAGIFTVTASNSHCQSTQSRLCIKIGQEVQVGSFIYNDCLPEGSSPDAICVVGEVVSWIPTVVPLNNLAEFSVFPSLPQGMSISPLSGEISGRPASAGGRVLYVVSCTTARGTKQSVLSLSVSDRVDFESPFPDPEWTCEQLQLWLRNRGGTDADLWDFMRHLDGRRLIELAQDSRLVCAPSKRARQWQEQGGGGVFADEKGKTDVHEGVTQAIVDLRVRSNPLSALPGYRVIKKLGQGGQGSVWEAENELSHQRFAIKIGLDTNRELLRREMRNLEKLRHQNVVRVLEFIDVEALQCIRMEVIPGLNLEQYRKRQPNARLEWETCAPLAKQFLRGLAHMHDSGILHRDLKPQNLMIDLESPLIEGCRRVVIVDLGLSKQFHRGDTRTHSREGQFLGGTPRYFSPEQLKAVKLESLREMADTWSAGVIIYELLCGRTPFELDSGSLDPMELRNRILTVRIEKPLGAPEAVAVFLLVAMRREPPLRFRSGRKMLNRLLEVELEPNNPPRDLEVIAYDAPREEGSSILSTVWAFPCKIGSKIDVMNEMKHVQDALRESGGRIDLKGLYQPDKDSFLQAMRGLGSDCLVLHFAGHGTKRRGGSFVWEAAGTTEVEDVVVSRTVHRDSFLGLLGLKDSIEAIFFNCCHSKQIGIRVWRECLEQRRTMYAVCWDGEADDRICINFASHFYRFLAGERDQIRTYGQAFISACIGTAEALGDEAADACLRLARILWVEVGSATGHVADEKFVNLHDFAGIGWCERGKGTWGFVCSGIDEATEARPRSTSHSSGTLSEKSEHSADSDSDDSDAGQTVRNWRWPPGKLSKDRKSYLVSPEMDNSAQAGHCEKEVLRAFGFDLKLDGIEIGTPLPPDNTLHGLQHPNGMLTGPALAKLGVKDYRDLWGDKGKVAERARGALQQTLLSAEVQARNACHWREKDMLHYAQKDAKKQKCKDGKKCRCKACKSRRSHATMLKNLKKTLAVLRDIRQEHNHLKRERLMHAECTLLRL